jgi:hypothetical protein
MTYIEFQFTDDFQFDELSKVFVALQQAKQSGDFHDDNYWLGFFNESAKAHFWWPTDEEIKDWKRHWDATPVSQRRTDPGLKRPWVFSSMIDAIRDSEYELVSCQQVKENIGRLELLPLAGPFGGTDSLKALIEAFGFRIIAENGA